MNGMPPPWPAVFVSEGAGERRRLGGRRGGDEMARKPECESDKAKRERDECRARHGAWLEALDRETAGPGALGR